MHELSIPPHPIAAVVFASAPSHADGPRDARIVTELYDRGVACAYVSLLRSDGPSEPDVLAEAFLSAAAAFTRQPALRGLPLGAIASGVGAAGVLIAAAQKPELLSAIVAIDARTDLAVDHLRSVKTPVLLVVRDMPVLLMNREALSRLRAERRIEIVHDCVETSVTKTVHWLHEKLCTEVAVG